jgi:hypothetical protein
VTPEFAFEISLSAKAFANARLLVLRNIASATLGPLDPVGLPLTPLGQGGISLPLCFFGATTDAAEPLLLVARDEVANEEQEGCNDKEAVMWYVSIVS